MAIKDDGKGFDVSQIDFECNMLQTGNLWVVMELRTCMQGQTI